MVQCARCGTSNRPSANFCTQCGARLIVTAPLPIGAMIQGRYKVVSLLGKGGMGAVYLVEDQKVFGKRWALKELLDTFTDPADRAQAIQQFEAEAKLLVGLSHPNLPQIADYFAEGGRQYLVMEFVDGETLEAILNKAAGFLEESKVLDWAVQLCDVLAYLHSQKPNAIIFRDLKPDNIMLTSTSTIKLIDFGVARLFDPAKKTDTLKMGTIGYAPPEQYAGHGQTDARSDIYALGVALHRLLTKHDPSTQPFVFPRPDALNNKISQNMVRVIMRATDVDPKQRYQSASDMKKGLLYAPGKGTPSTAPYPTPSRTPQVFVANLEDGTITVIDVATNMIQSALHPSNSEQYPHLGPIAITVDGKLCLTRHRDTRAYRSKHEYLGAMVIFDIGALRETRSIGVCQDHLLRGIAATQDMQTVVTSDGGAYVVDPDKGKVRHVGLKGKLGGIAILPSGKAFVAAPAENHVFVLDTRTDAVMSVIKVGRKPWSLCVSQDNSVWVAHSGEPKILGIDESTNLVKVLIESASFFGPSGFLSLAVAPNGKVYATTGSGRHVFVGDPSTGSFTAQIQVGAKPAGLVASDQGMVYVANSGDNTVSVIDSASDKVVAMIGVGRQPYYMAVG